MHIKNIRHHLTSVILRKDKCGEDVEKLEFLHTADGNTKWYRHCGKQYGYFSEYQN
jgi:hypothetical protein